MPSVTVSEIPPRSGTVVLLDVREDDEWEQGHAPDAVHIPMNEVPLRTDEIDLDADVYVVCRQGGRSIRIVEYLQHMGVVAIQVDGGMVAWQHEGFPLVCGTDGPARIY